MSQINPFGGDLTPALDATGLIPTFDDETGEQQINGDTVDQIFADNGNSAQLTASVGPGNIPADAIPNNANGQISYFSPSTNSYYDSNGNIIATNNQPPTSGVGSGQTGFFDGIANAIKSGIGNIASGAQNDTQLLIVGVLIVGAVILYSETKK